MAAILFALLMAMLVLPIVMAWIQIKMEVRKVEGKKQHAYLQAQAKFTAWCHKYTGSCVFVRTSWRRSR